MRFPKGTELLVAVEVADTSARQDLTTKRALYARAGVPEYWVLDLNRRILIVHRAPAAGNYEDVQVVSESETVFLQSANATIRIADLLP